MSKVDYGNANDDIGYIRADKTQAYVLKGNDTLISDNKKDILIVGGSGDDSLVMFGGNGTLSGGQGSDTFELTYSADKKVSAVIEDFDPSSDTIIVNFDGNTTPQLTSSVNGNDVVWTDSDGLFNLTLKGERENDYFDDTLPDEAWKVLELTNNEREKNNLPWLTMAEGLTEGASIRAQEITEQGNLGLLTDHTRPNGEPYYTALTKTYRTHGENLDGGATSAEQVVADWMNSPSHRDNILRKEYTRLGVGYKEDNADPSDLRYYWTQMFGDSLTTAETVSTDSLLSAKMEINASSRFITLSGGDSCTNTDYGATIQALGDNVSIKNSGLIASIAGSAGNDTIDNSGAISTINAGKGDDLINFVETIASNLIKYAAGDGNDTIRGVNYTDTLSISGGEFSYKVVGDDIVVSIGTDSITLANAAKSHYGAYLAGTQGNFFILSEEEDSWRNNDNSVTLDALGGNDTVWNYADSVKVFGGGGNDAVENRRDLVTIDGGEGNDTVWNVSDRVTIFGGDGDDSIVNLGNSVTIDGGVGNDSIDNYGDLVTIDGGACDDYIYNHFDCENVSMFGGSGNDYVSNFSSKVTMEGGTGDDTFYNHSDCENVTMLGGTGNDSIVNYGSKVTLEGDDGDDTLYSDTASSNVTILGGTGDDSIRGCW